MKYATTPAFETDWRRLKREHQAAFRAALDKFVPACDAWAAAGESGGEFVWPSSLRTSRMKGHRDIWEMTWSFASPDGRATFAFVWQGQEWMCLWRRIGGHDVYNNP